MFNRLIASLIVTLVSFSIPGQQAPVQTYNATAAQIIQVVNEVRASNGLGTLQTNSILMSTAQYTADIMASQMATSHIGNMKGRIIAAGYGSGYSSGSIWGTENFAVGQGSETAQQIVLGSWADDLHMIPMTNSYMCDIGVGVSATGSGSYYYVLHAAYNSDVTCARSGASSASAAVTSLTGTPTEDSISQWIVPVNRATPDEQGRIFHIVRQGQSLWSIAITYGTKINAILTLNNLPLDTTNLYSGERLLIPTSLTPYATETPAETETETATATSVETATPPSVPSLVSETPKPSLTPTVDLEAKAEEDERFRGGLFMALVISIVLVIGGLLVSKKPS